jgi:membrane associated rhomboid family serine protease
MGVYAMAAPARMLAPFDVVLGSAAARSEVRAVYGGFGLAIAAVLVVAITDPALRPGVLVTVAAALAGMALGRLASAVDCRTSFYPNWFYFIVEAVAAAALFMSVDVTG